MRFTNRSLTYRGSRRRVRAVRLGDNWTLDMTLLVATVLGVLTFVMYRALT